VRVRLNSTLFVKVKWGGGRAKDAAHAKYIATRPGVAMEAEAAHVGYMADRPRSTGLFGPETAERPELAATMREVAAVRGPAWRLVISLGEDDARQLGWTGLPRWQELTRNIMPGYERALGLPPGALRWVAAHHPEPGHPHVHVLAWDGSNSGRKGYLNPGELREVRRAVAREVYGPIRTELVAARTAERDFLVLAGRTNILGAQRLLRRADLERQAEDPGEGRLPPRFAVRDLEDLGRRLRDLAEQMPGQGRVALAYMPPEVKTEAREVADWILARPVLGESLGAMQGAVTDLTRLYSQRDGASDQAVANALADVRDRIAQAVLKAAADLQHQVGLAAQRALAPAAAVAKALGFQLAPEEERKMAELLRAVRVQPNAQGRPAAQGPGLQAAVAFAAARAPQATPASVTSVITHQAARIQRGERIEQQVVTRQLAGGVMGAAHRAMQRERRRAELKAELWREYEAERAGERREDRQR